MLATPKFHGELNPIEVAWSVTKARLRKLDTRLDVQNLAAKAKQAWLSITAEVARKLIRHSNQFHRNGSVHVKVVQFAPTHPGKHHKVDHPRETQELFSCSGAC